MTTGLCMTTVPMELQVGADTSETRLIKLTPLNMPLNIIALMKPIYQRLSTDELLKKCLHEKNTKSE